MRKNRIRKWVSHKLDSKVERRLTKLVESNDVVQVAVMPDVHLSGDVCNGVVVATNQLIYPQCVGGDIGCGYLAVDLEVPDPNSLLHASYLERFWNVIRRSVPVNKHSDRAAFESDAALSSEYLQRAALREGSLQLGTLGRGNHFVELQRDQNERYSILIHSGSRAMGQLITAYHCRDANVDEASGLRYLDADSASGAAYLQDMSWARQYAAANRVEMLKAIERTFLSTNHISVDWSSVIHLDHNHVQLETHDDKLLWVHRKGAQGLAKNQQSVVPGSMGATTYLVEGRGNGDSMNSCSHGAGRVLSRKEAAKSIVVKDLRRDIESVWIGHRNLKLLIDESPAAYKDIRKVMKAQKELVRIVGKRYPVLNFKGR